MKTDLFIKAARSIYRKREGEFLPLHVPFFTGNESRYIKETIDSTMVSSVGAYVDKFENDFALYTGAPKATAIVNGTSALQVSLRLAGVSPGDEVITQSLTFVATANAVHLNYAQPVFVDVDLDTMGLSPKALEAFLQEFADVREDATYNRKTGKKLSACMPMHTFGFIVRIDEILRICNQYKIPVVEDAAEALGSFASGISAGAFGEIGAFSFNGNKIITAGGGGALISSKSELMDKAKHLTTTAKVPHGWDYVHDDFGYNFRMPNLNAALVCAQLETIDKFKIAKREILEEYSMEIGSHFRIKAVPPTTDDWNHWLISLEMNSKEEKDEFLKQSNKNGVMTRPIWKLMHYLPMYKYCQRDSQENAQWLEDRIVNIPSSYRA